MNINNIHFLIAGGTIDNVCHDLKRNNEKSEIENFLSKSIKPHFLYTSKVVFMKDSRDINIEDREKLVSEIIESTCKKIVLTHGTYTMTETADYLNSRKSEFNDKVVVLTGAWVPLGDQNSDAAFNIGFAISACFNEKPGVYISINGKNWLPGEVIKNLESGRFEAV